MRVGTLFSMGLALIGALAGTTPAWASRTEDWQMGLLPPAAPTAQQVHDFNDLVFVIITAIVLFVLGLLIYVMWRFRASRNPEPSTRTHNAWLEVIWTAVPVMILAVIVVPSFRLLYALDRTENPEMTLVVRGYQWYWGYEYPDQQIGEYSAHMVPDEEIGEGQLRLLSTYDVTAPEDRDRGIVVLPVDTDIQILITAGDVLHSWAMPEFTIKTDAVPGRMNETWVRIEEEGTYYGQCSEICGTGHGFMPIEVRAVSREAFDEWVIAMHGEDASFEEAPILLTRPYPGFEQASAPAQDSAIDVAQNH